MPIKTHPIFMSFNSGEISPKMEGRIDLARANSGCNTMLNWYCTLQGGAVTDPGSQYIASQGDETRVAILIPFVFSALQPYIIEAGHLYFRFFMNGGQIMDGTGLAPYEIVTPYASTDLAELRWVANDFELYLFHPDHEPMVLTRTADNAWTLEIIDWIDGPYEDPINTPALTPSHTTAAEDERVADPGFDDAGSWTAGGADWVVAGGKATHAATGANTLSQDTGEANTEIYRVTFTLDSITSGKHVTMSIGGVAGTARHAAGTYTEYITATGAGDLTFTPEDAATACVIDDVSVVKVLTLTAATALFESGHVGSLWRIKHNAAYGYVRIESFVSSTVVRANTIDVLDGAGTAAAEYCEGSWSDVNGWPCGAFFHEGRLVMLGNYEWPNTLWASKTRVYDDMTPGTGDDDPYSLTIADLDVLRWGKSGKYMSFGAYSGEGTAVGGSDAPITATNPPKINTETSMGSANIDAIKAGRSIIYVQKAGKKVLEFSYDYTLDAYQPSDLTIISDHLTEDGITFIAFQQEPTPIIWAIRTDGALLGCTFDKQQKIVGWHEHTTDGTYESVACIPTTGRDQVWVTVARTIGGATKRFVEMFDPDISVQSGLTYSGVPATTITLAHLVGETVAIVGDGAVYPSQVVPAGGVMTISPAASEIYAGLPIPTPTLITNRPEVQIQGTSQGLKKRWNRIKVRVIDTFGITINGQVIPARSSTDLMGAAPAEVNGDIEVDNLGWDADARVTITQPSPVPAHVVAIFGDLVVGDA